VYKVSSFWILVFSCCLLGSCRKDNFENPEDKNKGTQYFPIQPGLYHEYLVDRIVFNSFSNTSDTQALHIRIEQDTFFEDNTGRTAMRAKEFSKKQGEENWAEERMFYYVAANSHIESIRENFREVRFSFPVVLSANWDKNVYNTTPPYLLYYDQFIPKYSLNDSLAFENCVAVKRLGRIIPFEENTWNETYAAKVGLIEREYVFIETINNQTGGIKEKVKLIKYGIQLPKD
jgi:hypothetical protein